EFLGARGYATAGFVANTLYCATDSGLDRGFARYRDYIFPRLTPLKPAALVDRTVSGLQALEQYLEDRLDFEPLRPAVQHLWWLVNADRKEAAEVNREFLDWLSRRPQPQRPFFAFLNYYDAHYPYQLPEISIRRFGVEPRDQRESDLIQNWWPQDKRGLSALEIGFVRDSYDDCVANLDEQLGRLIDDLGRRGVRDRTWVIIAADHGESFGEHAGVFCHGTSLYQTELHVPLVILPPDGKPSGRVVKETVSLRDLAATVVDLVGLEVGSPFPGESLSRLWNSPAAPADPISAGQALAEVVPNDPVLNPDRSRWLEAHWPLAALTEGDWSYIRREGDVHEELFHLRNDPKETHNLVADPAVQLQLARMRGTLSQLTAGPLTPQRFHP
ncbi:MAG TPA: sulfatase-like hydrolase/transferase, partial [Isosphaeraceae bacterium]|nr:sulfatase-like hydrolase/transferase [Isosphaeraceae bacterium]